MTYYTREDAIRLRKKIHGQNASRITLDDIKEKNRKILDEYRNRPESIRLNKKQQIKQILHNANKLSLEKYETAINTLRDTLITRIDKENQSIHMYLRAIKKLKDEVKNLEENILGKRQPTSKANKFLVKIRNTAGLYPANNNEHAEDEQELIDNLDTSKAQSDKIKEEALVKAVDGLIILIKDDMYNKLEDTFEYYKDVYNVIENYDAGNMNSKDYLHSHLAQFENTNDNTL